MTIAAGFRTDNGVLLCADQLHVSSAGLPSYAPKIIAGETTEDLRCRYGFAYAGSDATANVAIRNLRRTIRSHREADFDDLMQAIENTVRGVYHQHVTGKSESERDYKRFELLIAINRDGERDTHFMATADGTVNPVDKMYHFLGVGGAYGECVGRVAPNSSLSLDTAFILANRVLATAKRYSNDCGGPSDFTFIHRLAPRVMNYQDPFIEGYVAEYEAAMDRILLASIDPNGDDAVKREIDGLRENVGILRMKWQMAKMQAMLLDGRLPCPIATLLDPQSPKADQSPQPPSPELPGESDES